MVESTESLGSTNSATSVVSILEVTLRVIVRAVSALFSAVRFSFTTVSGAFGEFSSTLGAESIAGSVIVTRGFEFINPANWFIALTLGVKSVFFFGTQLVADFAAFTGMASVNASASTLVISVVSV